MATAFKTPPITVQQYQAFEGYPGLKDELIYGEIILSPQPKPLHQEILLNALLALREALNGQSFIVQSNSNIVFDADFSMPAPDVFVISQSEWRLARDQKNYLQSPPVLVVEVVSPANRKQKVEQKIALYLSNGVKEVWIIHPEKQSLVRVTNQKRSTAKSSVPLPPPLIGNVTLADIFQKA